MSRVVSSRNRPFWPSYVAFLFILILTLRRVGASPFNFLPPTQEGSTSNNSVENSTTNSIENLTDISINNSTNRSTKSSTKNSVENLTDISMDDLGNSSTVNWMDVTPSTDVYVIKAVVYEIGILADTNDTTSSESAERQEKVEISLYSEPQEDEF